VLHFKQIDLSVSSKIVLASQWFHREYLQADMHYLGRVACRERIPKIQDC
jgi:hypothetical protein